MNDCIFCKIIAGEIPAIKVYEDIDTFAFLDIKPVNIGHTLVLSKKHYMDIYDTPSETFMKMAATAQKIALAIKASLAPDGINIVMNNEAAAGQIILHPHIHVIPRLNDDGFKHWRGKEYSKEEIASAKDKIISSI